jgi:AraC-like DNA-binding protein
MSVQWGQDAGPNIVEGTSAAGGLSLFLPQYNADAILGNGCQMQQGSMMILKPGTEFCMASTRANRWSSVYIPFELLAAHGITISRAPDRKSVILPTASTERLRVKLETLGIVSGSISDRISPIGIEQVGRKIVEAVAHAVGVSKEVASTGRPLLSRSQITTTALKILEGHPRQQLSVSTLAKMIGISERTMRTAFEEYFGVGPSHYLKMRTLHHARKLLMEAYPHQSSVTEIALDLGIWELGRFSSDYKNLFSELPSETHRRSPRLSR